MSDQLGFCGKIKSRFLTHNMMLVEGLLESGNATLQILKLGQEATDGHDLIGRERAQIANLILKISNPIFQFTHFLRRSFASLGESRVVLAARPASSLTPPNLSRNIQMETAMTGTRRLIPERAQVISAYRMVTHPEEFQHEPHLHDQMRQAWLVLLADRQMRLEAQRAASAIRAAFPEDAA